MSSDDESMSNASFEDIGAGRRLKGRSFKDLIVKRRDSAGNDLAESGEVPDVLYVVEFIGLGNRVVDTQMSDKPIDPTTALDSDNVDGPKKEQAVLEIVTRVSTWKRSTRRRRARELRHRNSYYSDEDPVYYDGGRRQRTVDNGSSTTNMIIHSKHLKNALSAIVGYYPGVDFMDGLVSIDAPYQVLVHHMKDLELFKTNQPKCHDDDYAATTAKHIDILISFLEETLGKEIKEEERRWANDTPTATFNYFWLLLKPGEVFYKQQFGDWRPFAISRVDLVHRDDDKYSRYIVDYWNVEFADNRLQRVMESFEVFAFDGEQAIHTLPVIPARFFPGGAKAATEKQIRLGKAYWDLVKRPTYKEYDGILVGKDGLASSHLTGRVIVDAEGADRFSERDFRERRRTRLRPRLAPKVRTNSLPPPKDQLPQFKPRCPCASCKKANPQAEKGPFADLEDLDPNKDEMPDNALYLEVLTDMIPAFVLSERGWSNVLVEHLKEVKCDREAFKHLVLDDDIKLTVKALIGKFASADGKVSPWPNDLVKNKGEGRIFLLHGSPGVGKTCTAECVAELTRRPLLSLTSGDISTSMTAGSVEGNLNYFFQLGERFGALVLLDEADVYLEERRARDLRRNGLVSVFLRALEYYKGVLFLTTNRVESFDGAFTSRIHVALHYRRLTDTDRRRVWTNNFERLERDSGGRCRVPVAAREFAYESREIRRLRLNGREIRNALQTAVALAEAEAVEDGVESSTVTEEHLRAVAKMSRGFKDFLRKQVRPAVGDGDDEGDDEEEEEDGVEERDVSDSYASSDDDIRDD